MVATRTAEGNECGHQALREARMKAPRSNSSESNETTIGLQHGLFGKHCFLARKVIVSSAAHETRRGRGETIERRRPHSADAKSGKWMASRKYWGSSKAGTRERDGDGGRGDSGGGTPGQASRAWQHDGMAWISSNDACSGSFVLVPVLRRRAKAAANSSGLYLSG